MQHLQMWILKKTKTNVGKITFFKWQNLIRFWPRIISFYLCLYHRAKPSKGYKL
jgi:hypothetical protein